MHEYEKERIKQLTDDFVSDHLLLMHPDKVFHWKCSYTGYEFNAPFIDILNAEYYANRLLALQGFVSINELFDYISASDYRDCKYDSDGWSIDGVDYYGYYWIDFRHDYDNKTGTFTLNYPFSPHPLNEEWFESQEGA